MFIAFEGHDGPGKTTQSQLLKSHLESLGHRVTLVRSPGGSPISEMLRVMALNGIEGDVATTNSRVALMLAARIHTWETVIRPALERGEVVIADRWIWSGYLYQVVGEGSDYDYWKTIHKGLFDEGALPDLTLVLKMAEKDRLLRKKVRPIDQTVDVMETQGKEFETRIANAIEHNQELLFYTKRLRVIQVKLNDTVEQIQEEVQMVVSSLKFYSPNWPKRFGSVS